MNSTEDFSGYRGEDASRYGGGYDGEEAAAGHGREDTSGYAGERGSRGRSSGEETGSIATEFPAWEAWQGIDRLWHARIRGATPPVMVHGEDLVDLRDQILRVQGRARQRPEGPSWDSCS